MNSISPVKKAYQKHAYTKAQIKLLKQCKGDPFFFIENFCKVINNSGKEILFKLYPYQKSLLQSALDNQYTIALFGRQMGKTESIVSFMLWFAMFNKNRHVVIAAHNFSHVAEVMKRVKQVYEQLPYWLKSGVLKDGYNARSVKFENGSIIEGITTTPRSGRGKSIDLLYIDEFAFVSPGMAKEFWASIQPTLSTTGGKCIITSTPSSDDDEYAQLWHGAINTIDDHGNTIPDGKGRNGFKAIFAKWDDHPLRDKSWKEKEYAIVGDERFRREHDCQFISFDETLINPVFINEELNKMGMEPTHIIGSVRWYAPIQSNKTYIIGLDPSMGTGNDPAAIQVIQLPEFIQVGEWRHNKTSIPVQVKILQQILRYINHEMRSNYTQTVEPEIYWSVENNSIGEAALICIEELGEEQFPGFLVSEPKRPGMSKVYRKGFNTTNKKKFEAASRLKTVVENKKLKIRSKALIRELKFFVAKGSGYEAKQGETDDLVMATLLTLRMIQELARWDETIQSALVDETEESFLEPMPVFIWR